MTDETNKFPAIVDVYQAVFNALEKPGILPLVQAASELLQAPVVFTDENYNLIAIYPAAPIGELVYDTLLEQGKLPLDVITSFQQAFLNHPGKYYEPFYADYGPAENWPRIFAEVYNEKKILGHIGVLVGRVDVQPWQLDAAAVLSAALRIKMNMITLAVPIMSKFLAVLLDQASSYNAKEMAVHRLFEHRYYPGLLIVAPMNMTTGQNAFTSVVISHLQRSHKNIIFTVHHNDLVMLLTSTSPGFPRQHCIKQPLPSPSF